MRPFRQWIVWKYIQNPNGSKPIKLPINPATNRAASVTDPDTWVTFAEACYAYAQSLKTDDPYSGIGFVLTKGDPFCFLDLDDTHGDAGAAEEQRALFNRFDSYSEVSPSGQGLHIIVKGEVPYGRRRAHIEVYSSERYMTMTGDTYHDRPIEERQELLTDLWQQMGGADFELVVPESKDQKEDDQVILERARNAVNGEKFSSLWQGDWTSIYPSQSEADFALVDIIAFYTQNKEQISRLFLQSELGQRSKARRQGYQDYMINKSFDRQLPLLDFAHIVAANDFAKVRSGDAEPGMPAPPPVSYPAPIERQEIEDLDAPKVIFPPGLVGDIANFFLEASPRRVPTIALAGSIGLMSGVCGRAYNVTGTGLNQYVLILAQTGAGKDAVSSGISRLMNVMRPGSPNAGEFIGPGELVSKPGLIKWLSQHPSIVSVIGEFGLKLKEMSSPSANAHMTGLQGLFLQLYSKSGKGNILDPMAYSDTNKNTKPLLAPSLTIVGESTPETFYSCLDESMISTGLLPRFLIMEYTGKVPYVADDHELAKPSFSLCNEFGKLLAISIGKQHNNDVVPVLLEPPALKLMNEFDRYCTDQVNSSRLQVTKQLWNRAALKAKKLSGILSVGTNYINPVIIREAVDYSIKMIVADVDNLVNKFGNGDFGDYRSNNMSEFRQAKELGMCLYDWFCTERESWRSYNLNEQMVKEYVFTLNSVQMRMMLNKAFKEDRLGPNIAIKRAIQYFLDAGDIIEIPSMQMKERYNSKAKAYAVANMPRFAREFGGEVAKV